MFAVLIHIHLSFEKQVIPAANNFLGKFLQLTAKGGSTLPDLNVASKVNKDK
jgi:hypothetical protein